MSKLKVWVEAMRLRTLPVSIAGVLTAVGFCLLDGNFNLVPACLCLVFALLCQIASNFANEYYDYRAGRDQKGRSGPRRGVTEGDITPEAMKRATFAVLGVACAVGLSLTYWGGLWLIFAGIFIALGVTAYSAGPYPLSTHGLGEVAVLFFFGIVPVNLTYYVQALQWSLPVFAASVSVGLMGANVLIVNNYRDIEDDVAVGKRTLAVRFGRRAMLWLYAFNAVAAVALMMPVIVGIGFKAFFLPAVYLGVTFAICRQLNKRTGSALNPFLGMTAVTMFAYSLFFVLMTF